MKILCFWYIEYICENFVFLVLLEYICENFVFLVHTTGARVGGGVVPRRGVPLSVCVSVYASSSLSLVALC